MFLCNQAVDLKFQQPFDDHGVLYFIGTGGLRKAYENPHTAGLVVAQLSSAATDPSYSQPAKFVGRASEGYCCTDNRPSSFMSVDLGTQRRLLPTHYCLKNDGLGIYHVLRNWELQGKVKEDEDWSTIKRHFGDSSLANTPFAVADWSITEVASPFRFFRIYQFDTNSYGAHNIMCAGIELYGRLHTTVEEEADALRKIPLESQRE